MKTIYIKHIWVLFILVSTFSSCEKEITMDLHPSEPRLVVEGIVQEGEYAKIRLTMSKDYNNNDPYKPVEGAIVRLNDSKGNIETLNLASSGAYESVSIKGEQGVDYKLTIELDGNTYTSEAKMPSSVIIDTIFIYNITSDYYIPKTIIRDIPNEENYYRFIVSHNGKEKPSILLEDDYKRDGRLIERMLPYNDEDDEYIDMVVGDLFRVEMRCITKEAFDFYDAWDQIINGQAQANPPSNIKGGALGLFQAYTTSFKEYTVTADDLK